MKPDGFHYRISLVKSERFAIKTIKARPKNTGYPSRPLRNDRDSLTLIPSHEEGRHQVQKKFNIKAQLKTTPKSYQDKIIGDDFLGLLRGGQKTA
jgi:hypothetical protein